MFVLWLAVGRDPVEGEGGSVTNLLILLSFICHVSYTERRTTRALYRIRKERSKGSTIPL